MAKGKQKETELPRAVGYVRKSTKGKQSDGEERQEKSLSQQKTEILKLIKGRYTIVRWYEDEGISGWKRGANRPDFQRMLQEAKGLGAVAIVVDNIDRFSRAAVGDVQADVNSLHEVGVRWIVAANGKEFDLGARYDIGKILDLVIAVWSSCEYSRQLSRRVSLARRNAALEGKRTGGRAPYGMVDDGDGGLKHGEAKHIKVVRWVFDQFANHFRSMCSIADELNKKGTPAPRGGAWYVATIRGILKRKAYAGDFSFNEESQGQFFRVDENGEVVETSKIHGNGKVFQTKGAYTPVVDPKLFAKAEKRLTLIKVDRTQRKRVGYALTGVLVCSHCGGFMYGCRPNSGKKIVYRCNSPSQKGASSCKNYQVREDELLPFLMRALGEEIADLQKRLSAPPNELVRASQQRQEQNEAHQQAIEKLEKSIDLAEINLLESTDKRTRKSLDNRITTMRDELENLETELATEQPLDGYTRADLEALNQWWSEFHEKAVMVPVPTKFPNGEAVVFSPKAVLSRNREYDFDPEYYDSLCVSLDPRVANQALHELGAEVRLRWKTTEYKTTGGVSRQRHTLTTGRFRLGQQKGKLPQYVLGSSARRSLPIGPGRP